MQNKVKDRTAGAQFNGPQSGQITNNHHSESNRFAVNVESNEPKKAINAEIATKFKSKRAMPRDLRKNCQSPIQFLNGAIAQNGEQAGLDGCFGDVKIGNKVEKNVKESISERWVNICAITDHGHEKCDCFRAELKIE
jgi:hypothetical protein